MRAHDTDARHMTVRDAIGRFLLPNRREGGQQRKGVSACTARVAAESVHHADPDTFHHSHLCEDVSDDAAPVILCDIRELRPR